MKKLLSIFLILTMVLCPVTTYAGGISVYINDVRLDFDVPPQIIDGRTMVPMRKIFESLGAEVVWDQASQTATGKKDGTIVNVSINSTTLFKNGVPKALDVPPCIIDSRTLVPVRAIAESFDCKVDWISETRIVKISTINGAGTTKMPLSATEISDMVSPAVFYIEVYDKNSNILKTGSGFFISLDGIAVTNYHVIEGTTKAHITTIDGDRFNVSRVIGYDENLDIAILKVEKTSLDGKTFSKLPSITLGNSDDIRAGQNVYAIGSPVGLQNTISNGIVSNARQIVQGNEYIQITAAISHGSSGGALVNEYGEVLGITSAGRTDAENIGFAIPINLVKAFDLNSNGVPYNEFASNNAIMILDVATDEVEVNVGDTATLLVYADSDVADWSIFWHTYDDDIISCEWGDWLEEDDSICPLYITGERAGVATLTIYSDVDDKEIEVTVYVNKRRVETYSGTEVPTYTAITGTRMIDWTAGDSSRIYRYRLNVDDVIDYMEYLEQNGFKFYKKNEERDSYTYSYITPSNYLIMIAVEFQFDEVWILVP